MTRPLIRLRPRLRTVAERVPRGGRIADIGSDHGRLPRLLVASGRATHCVATERSGGPLRRLVAAIDGSLEADRIETRRGDGLEPLAPSDRIETLVVCGMGGRTMLTMLVQERLAELGLKRLILQPQSEWARLRAALERRGWGISSERLCLDRRKFYTVMTALPAAAAPSPEEGFSPEEWFEAGPCWLRDHDPLAPDYWRMRLERARTLGLRADGVGKARAKIAVEFAERVLAALA